MKGIPDWTFGGTWPHSPRWFETSDGRMHYVDLGSRDGRPVVLVHGNPTWGYLYRHLIPPLVAAGHRVIVPDHLGFGRSEKPVETEAYRVPQHAQRLEAMLESLNLEGAALVAHDWGGPIGLYWATRHPERVDGLFLINTLAHSFTRYTPQTGAAQLPLPLRLFRAPGVGELLVQGLDAFKPLMFRLAIERKKALTSSVRRAYRDVHPAWSDRAGMLMFARQLPIRPGGPVDEMNGEIERLLRLHFRSKPVTIAWGMKDRVLPSAYIETLWLDTLPNADVLRIEHSGHFVQEDAPEAVVPRLARFVQEM